MANRAAPRLEFLDLQVDMGRVGQWHDARGASGGEGYEATTRMKTNRGDGGDGQTEGRCRRGLRLTGGLTRLVAAQRTHADADPIVSTAVSRGGLWLTLTH